jgi:dynein heavy chain
LCSHNAHNKPLQLLGKKIQTNFLQAQEEVEKFLAEDHTFDEYKVQVALYDSLMKEIPIQLAHVITMGLFEMHREELISTMVTQARNLRDQLIARLTRDYQNLCKQ